MQPLSISINMPSRELEKSAVEQAVTSLALNLAVAREQLIVLSEQPKLDVTFLLAYQGDRPEFQGMRMGNYTPEENILFFQAAVPEAYNHSPLAPQYVAAVMDDVISNALDYFQDKGVAFDFSKWQTALQPLLEQRQASNVSNH